jgi:hypothetical protein
MSNSFVGYDNIVSGLQPVDAATTAKSTAWIDMKTAHSIAFLLQFGVVTATSANNVTITVEASTTNDSTTGVTVPFLYRQSGLVTANTWGAVTSCDSAGAVIAAASLTGTNIWVEADLPGITNDHPTARWIKAEVTGAEPTANLMAIVAILDPRYRQITYPSAT